MAPAIDSLFDGPGQHPFSSALVLLKGGHKMRRLGWASPDMWICLRQLVGCEMEGKPFELRSFFIMKTKQGDYAVWFPAICDILADDWMVVE